MFFLAIGLVLLGLKVAAVAPVADWSWWEVLAPFGLAVMWWWWADHSGYTKRQVMKRADQRKKKRIEKQRSALGLPPKRPR